MISKIPSYRRLLIACRRITAGERFSLSSGQNSIFQPNKNKYQASSFRVPLHSNLGHLGRSQKLYYTTGDPISINIIKSQIPSIELPNAPFCDYVLNFVKKQALNGKNKIAFKSATGQEQLTFDEVYKASMSLATFLLQNDFKKGEIATIVLPNCLQYLPITLGVQKAGGVASGANPTATDAELRHQLSESQSSTVFTNDELYPKILKITEDLKFVKKIIAIPNSPEVKFPSNVINFNDILENSQDSSAEFPVIRPDEDLAVMPFSSGTSGSSKGVMLTHRNILSMILIGNSHLDRYVFNVAYQHFDHEKERYLHVLPFYHVFGVSIAFMKLLEGACGVIMSKFDPTLFCAAIEQHKIRMLYIVPPIMIFLAKHPLVKNYDLSSVQIVLSGAAHAGIDICEELRKRFKNIKFIVQGYGQSECALASHFPNLLNYEVGSVGQLTSNLEMRIVDETSNKDVKSGEHGEVLLRGPTIMKGYINRPDQTNETIQNGWMRTGDIGYVDEKGNLYIVDRLKELIKVKGLQVAPAELEGILISHPSISDAAVIGVPDEMTGEAPRAYIVRADENLTEGEIHDYLKEHVSAYKFLRGGVEFVKEIPKSASGKILRRLLRENYATMTKK